jgi:hypothetical protein
MVSLHALALFHFVASLTALATSNVVADAVALFIYKAPDALLARVSADSSDMTQWQVCLALAIVLTVVNVIALDVALGVVNAIALDVAVAVVVLLCDCDIRRLSARS